MTWHQAREPRCNAEPLWCGGNVGVVGRKAAVEFVIGGEKVLDFGAGTGFLKSDGVEQDRWIWEGISAAFQFGQRATRTGHRLEHGHSFQIGSGWQNTNVQKSIQFEQVGERECSQGEHG